MDAAGTTSRGCDTVEAVCPAGAGLAPNVFGTTPLGWLGTAGVAGPVVGVPPRIRSAGTVGDDDTLDAGRLTAPTTGCAGPTRGATLGVPRTIGPAEGEPVLGVLAPPNSRFWSLVEFILEARSLMYASGFIGSWIPGARAPACALLFAFRVLPDWAWDVSAKLTKSVRPVSATAQKR